MKHEPAEITIRVALAAMRTSAEKARDAAKEGRTDAREWLDAYRAAEQAFRSLCEQAAKNADTVARGW